jgi:formylglycine-generating enzyme required for sulfatase activity
MEEEADQQRRQATAALDGALSRAPADGAARAAYADILYQRLLAAERLHHEAVAGELRARLSVYDDGSRAARLAEPARVLLRATPSPVAITLTRFEEDGTGRLVESAPLPFAAGREDQLPSGSYLLLARAPGRYPTRYPFVVSRGERRTLDVWLPPAAQVPPDLVYIPAGRFLYGSGDDEATRQFLTHQPLHEVELGPFLIGQTEVTNGAFAAYLRAAAPSLTPPLPGGFTLSADGRVTFHAMDGQALAEGQRYCPWHQPCVDWARLPVGRVAVDDVARYLAWLRRSGRLPGARLCTDQEWERAAPSPSATSRPVPTTSAASPPTGARPTGPAPAPWALIPAGGVSSGWTTWSGTSGKG